MKFSLVFISCVIFIFNHCIEKSAASTKQNELEEIEQNPSTSHIPPGHLVRLKSKRFPEQKIIEPVEEKLKDELPRIPILKPHEVPQQFKTLLPEKLENKAIVPVRHISLGALEGGKIREIPQKAIKSIQKKQRQAVKLIKQKSPLTLNFQKFDGN